MVDRMVQHIYTIENDLIRRMDIQESEKVINHRLTSIAVKETG